ncbi:MAG: hypothetical protein K4571_16665 [Deltaproteobacteria bacterium]
MAKDDVYIYSFTRTYGEMMPVEEFVRHMDQSIRMVEERTSGNLYTRVDEGIIKDSDNPSPLLMTLNF